MFGRKDYKREEIDNGRKAIDHLLTAYANLSTAVEKSQDSSDARAAMEAFEPLFFK